MQWNAGIFSWFSKFEISSHAFWSCDKHPFFSIVVRHPIYFGTQWALYPFTQILHSLESTNAAPYQSITHYANRSNLLNVPPTRAPTTVEYKTKSKSTARPQTNYRWYYSWLPPPWRCYCHWARKWIHYSALERLRRIVQRRDSKQFHIKWLPTEHIAYTAFSLSLSLIDKIVSVWIARWCGDGGERWEKERRTRKIRARATTPA